MQWGIFWVLISSLRAFHPDNTFGQTTTGREFTPVKAEFKGISRASTIQGNGQILTADYISSTLVINVGVGTPPQNFQFLVDTGSYIAWVRSSKCTSPRTCSGQPAFDASKSSTYKTVATTSNSNQQLAYGDGSTVSCTINSDVLTIGDAKITGQQICEASVITTSTANLDGIIGVGPPGNAKVGTADVFGTFLQQNTEAPKVISFWYNSNDSTTIKSGQAGEIVFGGKDATKFTGDFQTFNLVSSRTYWALSLDKITDTGGNSISGVSSSMVIDTGTTALLLPTALCDKLNSLLGATNDVAAGVYTIPCATAASLPSYAFFLAGSSSPLVITGRQWVVLDPGSNLCVSIVQDSKDSRTAILGAWFLRNYYVTFDYGASTIGFANPVGKVAANIPIGNPDNRLFGISTTALLIIIAAVLVVIAIIAALMFRKNHNRKVNQQMIQAYPGSYSQPQYPSAYSQSYPNQVYLPPNQPNQSPENPNQTYLAPPGLSSQRMSGIYQDNSKAVRNSQLSFVAPSENTMNASARQSTASYTAPEVAQSPLIAQIPQHSQQ